MSPNASILVPTALALMINPRPSARTLGGKGRVVQGEAGVKVVF